MSQPTLPTGARVVGPAHAGICGTWWRALAPDGTTQLVLRIATTDPTLVDRVATATRAVAALGDPGVLGTGEPIRHNGALWLVASGASGSTVSELAETDGSGIDLARVGAIAAQTARTLGTLHAAGLGHGAVHGRTVLVAGSGTVTLTEAALLPVLRGTPTDLAADRRAWAELVRWMAARWCGGQPGTDRLLRCVDLGEHDLPTAARELRAAFDAEAPTEAVLCDGPTEAFDAEVPTEAFPSEARTETFPSGTASTGLPDDAPTTALSVAPPADSLRSTRVPTRSSDAPPRQGRTYRSSGGDPTVTLPGPTTVGDPPATASAARGGALAPTGTEAPGAAPVSEVRFGPGVPAAAPSAPGWRHPQPPPGRPRRSRWRLVGSILSGLLTLALLVAVGLHLWQRVSPLEVRSVRVAVAEPPGDRCDVTVHVVATVETNGRAGTIQYQWLRSGTEPGALQRQRVGRGQQTVTLRLTWSFSGTGSTTETAVVNIVEPAPLQARTAVRYHCRPD